MQQASGNRFVHQDPYTKSQRLTDTTGAVTAGIDLDPWGGETTRTFNGAQLSKKYTTYDRNANGRDEAMMRSYHGWFSRFNQPDPWDGSYNLADPQSLNRHSYVQNDPVNFVDPSGLGRCWSVDRQRWEWCPDTDDHVETVNTWTWGYDPFFTFSNLLSNFWGPRRPHPITEFEPRPGTSGADVGGESPGNSTSEQPKQDFAALRERVMRECLERKKAEADQARAQYVAGYGQRVLRGMKWGGLRGAIQGGIMGAAGGFAFMGWGAVPGAIAGAFIGGTAGSTGGVITSGIFVEPLQRLRYDYWNYRPALDMGHIECTGEADSAVYRAGGP